MCLLEQLVTMALFPHQVHYRWTILESVLQSFMSASGEVLQQVATLEYTFTGNGTFTINSAGENFFCWKN